MGVPHKLTGLYVNNASALRTALIALVEEDLSRDGYKSSVESLAIEGTTGKVRVSGRIDGFLPSLEHYGRANGHYREWEMWCGCPGDRFCDHLAAISVHALNSIEDALESAQAPNPKARILLRKVGFGGDFPSTLQLLSRAKEKLGKELSDAQRDFIRALDKQSFALKNTPAIPVSALYRDASDTALILSSETDKLWLHPPSDPLEIWSFCALSLLRRQIAVPDDYLVFADLAWAAAQASEAARLRELAGWRNRFKDLYLPSAVARQVETVDLRLRLKRTGRCVFEGRIDGRPFTPISNSDGIGLALLRDGGEQRLTAGALALKDRLGEIARFWLNLRDDSDRADIARIMAHQDAAKAVVNENGSPIVFRPELVRWVVSDSPTDVSRLSLRYSYTQDELVPEEAVILPGTPTIYLDLQAGTYAFGAPAALPAQYAKSVDLPKEIMTDEDIGRYFSQARVALPPGTANPHKVEFLTGAMRVFVKDDSSMFTEPVPMLVVQTEARDEAGVRRAVLHRTGWQLEGEGDYSAAELDPLASAVRALGSVVPLVSSSPGQVKFEFKDETIEFFVAWLQTVPRDTIVELSPEIAHLAKPATQALYRLSVVQDANDVDWFDIGVSLSSDDADLTDKELQLLAKAKGRFVRLGAKGWRRLEVVCTEQDEDRFSKLGLSAEVIGDSQESLRYHAIQLADPAARDLMAERSWKTVCERAATVSRPSKPVKPEGVVADLRPYQHEGFEFLSFLSHNRFGGILADDMGLGKTLQSLTWISSLPAKGVSGPRVLVVCPKSVVSNWVIEANKFTPALTVISDCKAFIEDAAPFNILVINYAQLRLHATKLLEAEWSAVILDEGQNIKNPGSIAAKVACSLKAQHRVVLTGTPIENRLLDLWSLMHFAQPGLLGTQASFKRLYGAKDESPESRERLAHRIRHFLLRRTKGQVAKDLPPRIEEEIACEMADEQSQLYTAELKRARLLISGVENKKDFDAQRFNILTSLLRLRQISCHPGLVGVENAESGKLDALFEALEPMVAEGSKVLVFSQFVEMLNIISAQLRERKIGHLILTGKTENRQQLVDTFQSSADHSVFLLSLKAAGSGLNLTAASYVVLYDPWWNPAVEAQAIDRTHRIGQTTKVIAYRLIAKGTVEEKIRKLQKEKQEMASDVIKEGDIDSVMDMESLKRILA